MKVNVTLCLSVKLIVYLLLLAIVVSCSGRSGKPTGTQEQTDSRTVLSNNGVNLRVFDENGSAIMNPGEKYQLDVSTSGQDRLVKVRSKTRTQLRVCNLELRFEGNREYPTDILCGEAMQKHSPLTYTGCPNSGLLVCSQVIPGTKSYEVEGEFLQFRLRKGKHRVRNASGFNQDPKTDPIVTSPKVDPLEINKLSCTFTLRGEGNGNLLFDFADFGVVGAKYNQKRAEKPDSEVADGSNNAVVDFADFGIVGANYNKGIGGIDIYRDDVNPPTKFLGRLSINGKLKGDFTLEPTAMSTGADGFKSIVYKVGGSGQFVKYQLVDMNGQPYPTFSNVFDTSSGSASDWRMFGREPNHSHRTTAVGPETNATKWTNVEKGKFVGSAVISTDGSVCVGNLDSTLYCYKPDGSTKWTFPTGGSIFGTPAVDKNGYVYIGSMDKNFYSIKPDGSENWKHPTGNGISSSPVIGPNGFIYVGSEDKNLYAFNPNGTKEWQFEGTASISSSPAIGPDGTVYVGCYDKKLYAINPDTGSKKWEFEGAAAFSSSPAIAIDGTIYIGSVAKKLYAVSSDGKPKWEFVTNDIVSSSPAIGFDGTIYVGSYDKKLYAINPDGTKKWEFITDGNVYGSPSIDGNGTIYIGSLDKKLYAIKTDGTKKWEFLTGDEVRATPTIAADGTIYIGSGDNAFYAFGIDNNIYPPEEVEASKGKDKAKIIIKWKAPKKGKVPKKFNVRRKAPDKEYVIVKSLAGDVFEWDDVIEPPDYTKFEYVVTSLDELEFESLYSTPAQGWLLDPSAVDKRGGWWTENGNAFNTRQNMDYDATKSTDTSKQIFDFASKHPGDEISTGGTYNSDGVTYFGTKDGELWALDPATGAEVFFIDPIPGNTPKDRLPWMNTPTVLPNGYIVGSTGSYNPADPNQLFIADPLGVLAGPPLTLDGTLEGGVYPAGDGSIFFGTSVNWPDSGSIWHVGADGKEIGHWPVPGAIVSSPTLIPNTDAILFGSYTPKEHQKNLHEINILTDTVTTYDGSGIFPGVADGFGTSPVGFLDPSNGTWLYGNSENGNLYKVDWPFTTPDFQSGIVNGPAPILVSDTGNVYSYNSNDKKIYGFNSDMETLTGYPLGAIATNEYRDSWLDKNGKMVVWSFDSVKGETDISIFNPDGTLYLGISFSGDSNLVTTSALEEGKILVIKADQSVHYY